MHTFQEIVANLNEFWRKQGCIVDQPYDLEKGAGTFNPATFLRCLGPEPYRTAYIEPCRRPKDGRYGTNPNRLQRYFQYQVILKPAPYDIQDLYLKSLEAIGLNLKNHDIRFVHDDWESPTLGAWGLGWEVWIDGQEATQFTYFQSVAGIPLSPITGEITYGIERIAMYLQNKDSIFNIQWNEHLTYGDLFLRSEQEWSKYNFELLDAKMWLKHFEDYENEAKRVISLGLPLPAYDFVIKASHAFNMLDANGVISVSERANYIANIRNLARLVAECYLEMRKNEGYPLVDKFPKILHPTFTSEVIHESKTSSTPCDFVFEIGSEELPAAFVPIGLNNLERQIKKLLDDNLLSYSSIKMLGTPRRLAVFVHNLTHAKAANVIEKRGPSLEHAFHQDGTLKAAGEGFFKTVGKIPLTLNELTLQPYPEVHIREVKGVKYLFSVIKEDEISTIDILKNSLSKLVSEIDFPKKMRWADLDITYARPIRWITALFGSEIVPFSVGPIQSGNISFGHRQLDPKPFPIDSASSYTALLKSHFVLVDPVERKEEIERQLTQIEKDIDAFALVKERVIPQVLNLVEWPYLAATSFDERFLKAPKEVLISEMVEHQKYFPVGDKDGNLKNLFIITANTKITDSILYGNRKVISARLSDGVFLFEQDLKTSLDIMNDKLKGVIFQKGLGTVYDKIVRLQKEVKIIANSFQNANLDYLNDAATYCKADLTSEMVGEFPELQGQMGRIYALFHGKPKEVALAIDEHWMPRGENGQLPSTLTGTILSLAEKIDNLIGFFALGLKPTSSSDPHALRRQALGIIRILINNKTSLELYPIFKECLKCFPENIQKDGDALINDILTFLSTRAKSVLQDSGFPKGEIDACLTVRPFDFYDLFLRLDAIDQFRKKHKELFSKLIEVYKRSIGQIGGHKSFSVSEEHLIEEAEKVLYSALISSKTSFDHAISLADYPKTLQILAELQPHLNELFNQVKVLANEEHLRNNRLALLQNVSEFFLKIADFQKISP